MNGFNHYEHFSIRLSMRSDVIEYHGRGEGCRAVFKVLTHFKGSPKFFQGSIEVFFQGSTKVFFQGSIKSFFPGLHQGPTNFSYQCSAKSLPKFYQCFTNGLPSSNKV